MTIHLEPLDMTQAEAARAEADKANPPPKGFKLTGEGIQYEGEPDDDGKTAWHWLCSPIRVLALPRGEDGKGWGRLVEVIDPDGNAHRWALPASLFAGDGAELRAELMRLGFRLSTSPKARQRLSDLLQQWTPKARATTTDRLGWPSAACRGFVLGSGRVIGDQSLVYQVEQAPGAAAHMHERGDLEEWKARVSSLCVGNPMLALGVSIAFAGPLLEPLQVDGGGVHFRGDSSTGKTTTSRAAVSVWGAPELMATWRATSNGLEGIAAIANSSLLALDEIGEVSAREAGGTAYMVANGRGKQRAARTGTARPSVTWRTNLLSTGEISLADKVAEAGGRTKAGQEVRLLDIQCDGRAHGVFDELHGFDGASDLADHIRRSTAEIYGGAGPAFVSKLIEDLPVAVDLARPAMEGFKREAMQSLGLSGEGQTSRALERFALIAAAGEMATAWGLTGWPIGEAKRAALTGLSIWLDGRGGEGSHEDRQAIERVRDFLVRHGSSRFELAGEAKQVDTGLSPVRDRAGWRSGGVFYVAKGVWEKEVHAGSSPDASARALKAAGFLACAADRLTTKAPRSASRARCYGVKSSILGDDEGGPDA